MEVINKTEIRKLIKRANDLVHGDDYFIFMIKKNTENSKLEFHPYYFCDNILIKKIEMQRLFYEKISKDLDEECCVCLEKIKFVDKIYFVCKHFVCVYCFLGFKKFDSKCPICRSNIKMVNYTNKYVLLATGFPIKINTFENGGYHSICLAYFPVFHHEKSTIFKNITYHKHNPNRKEFIAKMNTLFENGYNIVFQQEKELKKWINDINLKELILDEKIFNL